MSLRRLNQKERKLYKKRESRRHSQTLSLSRNLQSMKKNLFFTQREARGRRSQIIFDSFLRTLSSFVVKLHCVDVNFLHR